MKLPTIHLFVWLMLPFLFTGCIKDDQPVCMEEIITVSIEPDYILLPYTAQTPASQNLTVTCLNDSGYQVNTFAWVLSMPEIAGSWLQLTFDPAGLSGKGTSVSGQGARKVYLVAQENTTDATRSTGLTFDGSPTVTVIVTQEFMPIQVSPSAITLSGTPHNPAVQTVSVTANRQWTLTANQAWLTLSLNANGSAAAATVSSTGNRTVYLIATGNSGNVRTAGIYLNGAESDVRVTVNQESLVAEPGQAAPRLYISGTDEEMKLLLTKEPTNYGAFFQYGSVIGWNWEDEIATYNPTHSPNLRSWNSAWNNGNKMVIHTLAELLQGRGDPCRLAGYTVAEIKTALTAGRTPDNGQWRLPSNSENIVFGGPYSEWTTIKGISGRVFTGNNEPDGLFLPAAGRKIAEPVSYGQRGNMGFYVSSSIDLASASPFMLFFNAQNTEPSDYRDRQSQGYSVRCVRQQP